MADYRKKVKKNIPKVELHSIMSLIVGSYKTGKTRLWKEVTELHYPNNPDAALLIAFEKGYETWELENFIPIHEEGEEWQVWEYFKKELVKGLVQEARDERVVKLIGIDTADRCIDACTAWVLKDRAKKYGKPSLSSLQEITTASGGDENGWTALYDELKVPFEALRNAGYGLMILGWTKEKETTLYNGMKYNSVELMMNNTCRKVFESQASLICCLHNEVTVTDREGNELTENLKDKKKREVASNFHETRTMMYFRPSEYVSIAGGRYTDLPEEPIPYSAGNFMSVFEEAVKGQLKKTEKTVEELKVEEEQERETKAKNIRTAEELISDIKVIIDPLSDDTKVKIGAKFKEILGTAAYSKSENPALLQLCLNAVLEYKK